MQHKKAKINRRSEDIRYMHYWNVHLYCRYKCILQFTEIIVNIIFMVWGNGVLYPLHEHWQDLQFDWLSIFVFYYILYKTPFVIWRDNFLLSFRNLDNSCLNGNTFIWNGNGRVDIHNLKYFFIMINGFSMIEVKILQVVFW